MNELMIPTDTTLFVNRSVVMVECDYHDDRGTCLDQVALTRAENELSEGRYADRDMIAALRTRLGIPTEKRVTVVQTTTGRRTYRRVIDAAVLTGTLGPYYTKMTVPYSILNAPEVCDAWDKNPIEVLEVSMIPADVNPDSFRTHRFKRVARVSLHFVSGNFNNAFTLLTEIEATCCGLELRNVRATDQQLKVLQLRLQHRWLDLKTITLSNGRNT